MTPPAFSYLSHRPVRTATLAALACAMVAGTATAAGAPADAPAPAPAPASASTPSKVGAQTDWTLDPIAKQVAQRFASRFDGMDVTAVRMTPYGLYEVQLDTDLVYTNQDVSWVMQGPLIDAQTRENVSAKRLEQLSAIDFADLPKNLAIKQVKGDGSRVIAIFEDPNCGYCKQLRKTLEGVDNLTVYTYLFPILSPDSTEKARNVWCAKDQGKAWDDWMLRGKVPAQMKCDAPIEAVLDLGKKLMVRGTPAIFFSDGSRSAGALPLEHLLPRL